MPHTPKRPANRWRLATILLAATLAACAGPSPVLVDAPAGQQPVPSVRAEPAVPAAATPTLPEPPPVVVVPEPTAPDAPASDGPAAEPLVQAQPIDKGLASWYGKRFHGRRTASGERYDMHAFTAAHKTLPFGTKVRVRSVHTGKEVVVRINDRGPYKNQRIIDLSFAAITALGVRHRGVTAVELLRE